MATEDASMDKSAAEALRIAEAWLIKQGWKYTPADVGKRAREILTALSQSPDRESGT